jgi:hypothetical protein
MISRTRLSLAAAAWLLIGGGAAAETVTSAEPRAAERAAYYPDDGYRPYGRYDGYRPYADRYSQGDRGAYPRSYAWRPWYSDEDRQRPYDRSSPRWSDTPRYDGPPRYRHDNYYSAPRSYRRGAPYDRYGERYGNQWGYNDRRYDNRRYDDRWTATPPYPLPRWADAPRYDGRDYRWRNW